MEESSFGPPVARPSVWQNIGQDTLRWTTSLNLTGGPAFLCWVTASSALIGKLGKVNPLLPAINLITGFVTIKIFKTIHDHCQEGRGKDEIPQAIRCLLVYEFSCGAVALIQAIAMKRCLGIDRRLNLFNPNDKACWIAIAAVGLTALWAGTLVPKTYHDDYSSAEQSGI